MKNELSEAINNNNIVIEESYNNNKTSIILENEIKKYDDDNPINRYILMKHMEKISGYNIENFTEDFNLLYNHGRIGINNFGVYYKKDSVKDYIKQNYDSKISNILLDRLNGLTLEEIGEKNEITRERVRQICKKQFDRIISLNYYEDKYSDIFKKYDWTKKVFCELFNLDSYIYEFLSLKYDKGNENINGILFDDDFDEVLSYKRQNKAISDTLRQNTIFDTNFIFLQEINPKPYTQLPPEEEILELYVHFKNDVDIKEKKDAIKHLLPYLLNHQQ